MLAVAYLYGQIAYSWRSISDHIISRVFFSARKLQTEHTMQVHPVGARGTSSRSSSEEPQGQLMRAIYDYSGSQEDDISFCEGDLVRIMYEGKDGWAEGLLGGKYGYVPIAYFEPVQ